MDYTEPHTCPHCERILVRWPEDDPELHNKKLRRLSLASGEALSALTADGLGSEEPRKRFLLEVKKDDLNQFSDDSCLFYAFIKTGIKTVATGRDRFMSSAQAEKYMISIGLKDDLIALRVVSCTADHGTLASRREDKLNHCSFVSFPVPG